MSAPVRILHCHSTFSLGGKEARAVRLMNAFGGAADHVVISAEPEALGARAAIAPGVKAHFPDDAPSLAGRPRLARYRALARYMAGFDLVLTYNWGAMDAVMAHRIAARSLKLPPLIHHEDGFNADEVAGQKLKRVIFRRLALPTAFALVVPSQRLEEIARTVWRQPVGRVRRIANGIPLAAYAEPPAPDAVPGLEERAGEIVVGTLAGLRAVKNLPRLVRVFAAAGIAGRLVIVGEGSERNAIVREANDCQLYDRLVLPGFLADPARYVGLFDVFALSSDSEQFPISLVEAMAAGLPVVATDVGDVGEMVARENRRFIVPPHGEAAFADALRELAGDAGLRRTLGDANRAKAAALYGEEAMIAAYRALYSAAIRRQDAFAGK